MSTNNTFSDLSQFLSSALGILQQYLDKTTFKNPIPLIGTQLTSGGSGQVISQILGDFTSPVSGTHLQAIRQGLFDLLGPAGLDLLTDRDGTGYFDLGDIDVINMGGRVAFQLTIHQDFSANTGQFGFDTALPGLPLSVSDSGSVRVGVGFDLNLNFGIDQLAGQSGKPFVDPSTLAVQVHAGIPGMTVAGKLGFLQATVQDDPNAPSSFIGTYNVSFASDPSSGLTSTSSLNGSANLNLIVSATFGPSAFDPKLSTEIHLGWLFDNASPEVFPFGDTPTINFDDVQLDLGSFLTSFVKPLVDKIQSVTEPLEPLAKFLLTPIPFLSTISSDLSSVLHHNGPIYFTDLILDPAQAAKLASFANALITINGLNVPSSSMTVDLGHFSVTDPRQTSPSGGSLLSIIGQANPDTDVYQQIGEQDPSTGNFFQSLPNTSENGGFDFPILDDPINAFDLFMGINTTLFSYTMPTLSVAAGGEKVIPTPIPFVNLEFTGTIALSFSATFGYDTTGFMDGNLADGFFVQDATVSLDVKLGAGLQLGILDTGGVGPDAGINGLVNFTFKGPGNSDKVYGSQIDAHDYFVDNSGSIIASLSFDVKGPFDPLTGESDTLFSQDWGTATIYTW